MANNGAGSRTGQQERGLSYKWVAMALVGVGTFMTTLDASIVNIAFPALAQALATSPSIILWVTAGYLLVSTGLLLVLGNLGDLLGRKQVYTYGFLVFTLGLGLCSVAQNVAQLILFRLVQGVGAAMVTANSQAIVVAAFPGRERGRAMGILSTVVAVGLASGPTLGGILVDLLGWRSIFYLRLPVGMVGSVLSWMALKNDAVKKDNLRFDFPGAIALSITLSGLLLLLNQWNRLTALGIAALALLTIASFSGFVFQERRAPQPVVELRLFRNPLFASASFALLLTFLAAVSLTFLAPFYMIQSLGYSAARAGVLLTSISLVRLVASPLSGWLYDRIGYRFLGFSGMLVIALGLFLMSRLGTTASLADLLLPMLLAGLGWGLFEPPNNSAIIGAVPRDRLGIASATVATARQIGLSGGLALSGAIFTARQASHYALLSQQGLDTATLARQSVVGAFQDTLMVAAVVVAAGALANLVRERHIS